MVLNADPTMEKFRSDGKQNSRLGMRAGWGQAQEFVVVLRRKLSSSPLALGVVDSYFCEC